MKVSIIVPVYNAEKKIKSTVNSVLEQSFQDFELILVNDGSNDNSGSICDHFSQISSKIRVIHQKNSGPSAARNSGIQAAVGEYITFLDADDTVDPNWLLIMLNIEKQYQPDLIITGYKCLTSRSNNVKKVKAISPQPFFFKKNEDVISGIDGLIDGGGFNPLWNKLYKSEIIKINNLFLDTKYNLGEDFLFNISYIEKCKSVFLTSETPYNYIVEGSSLTHRYREEKFEDLKAVTLEYREFLNKHNKQKQTYYFRLLRNCYSSFMELFHKDSKMDLKGKTISIKKIVEDRDVQEMLSLYKPNSRYKKFIFGVLRSKNLYLILFFSRLFYIKKFLLDKR